MQIRVLGPLELEPSATPLEPRDRAALSALVRRDFAVSPDELADAIWGEPLPATWSKQVQICIARLRKVVGPDCIETIAGGYRLVLNDAHDLDLVRFEELIRLGRGFAGTGEADRAMTSYARALSLWRGHPLDDVYGWPPGYSEAGRLEELRRQVEEDRLEAMLEAGEHRQVAAEAESLASAEPLRERRWMLLALAQYRSGRPSEALRTLLTARKVLADETGVDPTPQLVELEEAILRQDVSLIGARVAPDRLDGACPYRGLAPHDDDHADAFFGRDQEIALCVDRLKTAPVLVLAGRSGSGKSSLARAGIVPMLRRRGQEVVVMVPGRDPQSSLAEALSRFDDRVVLVVDQFEEIYAGASDEEADAFGRRIVAHARERGPVVIVIRSDHLGELARVPALRRMVEEGLYLVSPLIGDTLKEAIVGPAEQAGLKLEHGLVDLLIRDTEGEPGALPLLSHALAETWAKREGRVLTVEGYNATGGIRGAVARTADRLYEALPSGQRELLRSVMLRLVSPSLEGDPVRRRLPSRALLEDVERARVISLLVRSRLVTTGDDSVELAHEAIARAWPRLRSWLDEDTDGQRILRHLNVSAEAWDSMGQPSGDLYRGARLMAALEWWEKTKYDLTDVEITFLEDSKAQEESETRALAQRATREAKQNQRLRILLAVGSVFLVAAIVAGVLAVGSRKQAELEALSNQSLALRPTNRSVAALLAVEAYQRGGGARAWSALLGTFTETPNFLGYQYLPGASLAGALIPGSSQAVVALDGTELAVYDLETGELQTPFDRGVIDAFESVIEVSDDGKRVAQLVMSPDIESCEATGSNCSVLTVLDLETGETMVEPFDVAFNAGDVALSPDGSMVAAAGGMNGDLAVYDAKDGDLVGSLPGLGPDDLRRNTAAVAFSRNGMLYVGSQQGKIRIVDPESFEVMATIEAPARSSNLHIVATEEGTILGGGPDAAVAVEDTGQIRWTADLRGGNSPPCPYMAVSESVDKLFCGNFFGVIQERDLQTGVPTGRTLDPQLGIVGNLSVTADGLELVAFGGEVSAISRWRLDGTGLVTRRIADGFVAIDGYEPGGDTILVQERPPMARVQEELGRFVVWDPDDNRPDQFVEGHLEGASWLGPGLIGALDLSRLQPVSYQTGSRTFVDKPEIPLARSESTWPSAGGTRIYALLRNPGEVWTFDTGTLERIEPTIRVDGIPLWVSATRDGAEVVVTYVGEAGPPTTSVFDGQSGELIVGGLVGPRWHSVSLDGLLVGAEGGAITQYDLKTLEPIAVLPGARGEVNSLQWSDDERVLLATSNDQSVSVYDVATWTRIGDPIPTDAPLTFPGHLRPDGEAVAVTVSDGVEMWDIDAEHLAEAACRMAGRNLTETEWDTYLGSLGEYRKTCDF
jgi:DNA-binding SARP family transcriptional activator/WD40 repeat protein